MDLEELLSRLALALGIGLLIGLERGWRTREAAPGSRSTAGIRTFAISGFSRRRLPWWRSSAWSRGRRRSC
jgi:uncharacterized membrane protein YhiD involved in acid resistance